jgi:hypothetical protein
MKMATKKRPPQKTKRKPAAKSATKSAGKPAKKKSVQKRAAKKPSTKVKAALAASVSCVSADEAQGAVDGCDLKLTGSVHGPDTKLGNLFPTTTSLNIFRRCVADRTGVNDFTCSSDDTKQDAVIKLTC